MEKCNEAYCSFRSTRSGAVTSHIIAAKAQRRDGGPVFPCRSCRYIMCVSCGHKCTQFPDKASVPEDQDLEEVARGLYAAGTISFKLPTTTASALPADSFGGTARAGVAPMGTAVGSAGFGSVELNNIAPASAATYRTAPRATPQYTIAPNATTAYASTQYYSAPHTTAPYNTAAYAPTQFTTAPYTTAPHTFAPFSTAPAITAQPFIATQAPSTPNPEPQLQPTNLLIPSTSLAAPFALITRPPGILGNRTRSEGQATNDPRASYLGQNNEQYRYPEASREGYYMALSRRRRE